MTNKNSSKNKKKDKDIVFNSFEDVKKYSKQLEDKFTQTMSTYEKLSTTSDYSERVDYIIAAIYLSLKKVFPEGISFRIDYRTKSYRSMQKSTSSEIIESDTDKLKKDIFGAKIIITDIDGKIDLDPTNPKFQKLIELQNTKMDNITFISETRKWISGTSDEMLNEENYYTKTQDILNRLKASTYDECTEENEISYDTKLNLIKDAYTNKRKNGSLSLSLSKDQSTEAELLLNDLEKRLDDKLERELVNVFLPEALSSNLLSNMLETSYKYDKEKVKTTGYVADFYNLNASNDFSIELQTQSYFRYLDGKKGVSFHNGLNGKGIKTFSFFELVDKNDAYPIEYYLNILSQMPINTYENGMLENNKSNLIKKVEDAYSHVKIKNKIKFSDQKGAKSYDMNTYLLRLAEYVSANMSICRSAHNFSVPTVTIEHGTLTDAFSDVLRQRDGISCLAQMLVDELNSLLEKQDDNRANKTYKQINTRDIINYSKTLPNSTKTEEVTK